MNCYLLHVPRLPSQPASNVGGYLVFITLAIGSGTGILGGGLTVIGGGLTIASTGGIAAVPILLGK